MTRRCSFVFDREEWHAHHDRRFPLSDEELEDGRWRCPRAAVDGDDCCLFHQRPADRNCSHDEFASAFATAITDDPDPEAFAISASRKTLQRAAKQFIGARIGTLRLSYERLEATDTYPIDLRGATATLLEWNWTQFGERVLLDGATVETLTFDHVRADADVVVRDIEISNRFRMNDATITGDVVCKRATIDGGLSLSDSEVRGAIELKESECESKVAINRVTAGTLTVRNTEIDDDLSVRHATLEGDLECDRNAIGGRLDCNGSDIRGDVTWNGTETGATASFESVTIDGRVECRDATVGGRLTFRQATVAGDVRCDGIHRYGATVSGVAVADDISFIDTRVGGDFQFACDEEADAGPTIGGYCAFTGLAVDGAFRCEPTVGHPVVDLSSSNLADGVVSQPEGNPLVYDFTDATLGSISLRSTPLDHENDGVNPAAFVLFERTTFDGFPFGDYRQAFDDIGWALDVLPDDAERTLAGTPHLESGRAFAAAVDDLHEEAATTEELFEAAQSRAVETAPKLGRLTFTDDLRVLLAAFITGQADDDTGADVAIDGGDGNEPVVADRGDDRNEDAGESGQGDETKPPTPADRLASVVAQQFGERREPSPETRESTYLKAKNGANDVGDNGSAAACFLRERRHGRANYRANISQRTGLERLQAGYRYVASLLFAATAGYGEHPGRVILTSLAVIGLFSGYYTFLGTEALTLEEFGTNLLFSIQSFVTFIVGSPIEDDAITLSISLASSIQGFLGAFLIALFVFSLTRSVNR